MQGKAGTIRYMAPEMKCNKTYDASVDVYSFGILLWQIITARVPFQDEISTMDFFVDNDDDRKGKIDDKVKMRPDLRYIENKCISSLLQDCWNHNATERWMFDAIVVELKDIVKQMQEEEKPLHLEEEEHDYYNNSLICIRMTRLFQLSFLAFMAMIAFTLDKKNDVVQNVKEKVYVMRTATAQNHNSNSNNHKKSSSKYEQVEKAEEECIQEKKAEEKMNELV